MHPNANSRSGRCLPALIITFLLSGFLFAASAPSALALPTNFFGLQFGPPYLKSEADLEAVGRSGAKYWRIGINCFDWYGHESTVWKEEMDTRFRLAWEHGVQVLPVLSGRCQSVSDELPSRSEWGIWESFAQAAVEHYGYLGSFWQGKENKKEVENWEIQNEPNLSENGIAGVASGIIYAEFFQRISEKLHVAQGSFFPTHALVGGLYYLHSNGPSKTPHTFVQEMSLNVPSVKPWIDGVAIHPYESGSGSIPPIEADISEARNDISGMLGANKGLWITEVGWPVENGDGGHANVTTSQQAQLLTELSTWVKSVQVSKEIDSLIYYNYRDFEYNTNPWWTRTGLRSGVPNNRYSRSTFRPAWYAFQAQTGVAKWPVPPLATTQPATGIASDRVTLNGIINPHGLPTGYHFELAENGGSFSRIYPSGNIDVGWKEGNDSVSVQVENLLPNTLYAYRIVPTNENNEVSLGAEYAFRTTAPAAAAVNTGSVTNVYIRGTNGHLYQRWCCSPENGWSGWSGWWDMGTPPGTQLASGPAAVRSSAGNTNVYVRGTNGHLYQRWCCSPENGWSGWSEWWDMGTPEGAAITSSPAAVRSSAGNTNVYVRGTNGHLYQRWCCSPENGWSGWSEWWDMGGLPGTDIGSAPAAVRTYAGNTNVYVRGTNGHLYQRWCCSPENGWSGWSEWWDMGGLPGGTELSSEPAAADTGTATNVYVRGTNGHLYQRWCCSPENGWSGWSEWWDMGGLPSGEMSSGPAAVRSYAGYTNLYAEGANGHLYQRWCCSPENGWSGWSEWWDMGAP